MRRASRFRAGVTSDRNVNAIAASNGFSAVLSFVNRLTAFRHCGLGGLGGLGGRIGREWFDFDGVLPAFREWN